MEINDADVAELVDARDLKSPAVPENAQHSCKTPASAPVETAANPAHLQNISGGRFSGAAAIATQMETDRRLLDALATAGRSALGMPSSVDTFKAWLYANGLMLVLA